MESADQRELQRQLEALQARHPELDPLAALVLLAVRHADASYEENAERNGVTTAALSRRLGVEHALVRRAATELEALNLIATAPNGGASPALRLRSRGTHPPNE
ncbi:MarR family transcriptional regulator [Salinicola rhizosphaerae]|uniref:MarR family transcriptional regulator n=1 Tax=Salinicola rhizosphaerae TaxID=1443141 RepID=A0ABQ3EBN9_9GAMM|nr:MarR family transcriptional regulator [Salinicola rhizosphaerae]GHB32426.1 hypothetical protein GCM10009038_34060 [Salinicola rhizosphaerae]